jgi:isoquinoline 1-oxidoreductase beta subunit
MAYRVPNRSVEYTLIESGVPRGWWRAVSTTHVIFAVESFIDELALAAGRDPLEYRLALIDQIPGVKPNPATADFAFQPERLKGVLRLAAEKAGWGKSLPPGTRWASPAGATTGAMRLKSWSWRRSTVASASCESCAQWIAGR